MTLFGSLKVNQDMRPALAYKTPFLIAASILVAAMATAAVQSFTLKRVAKEGDTSKSKVNIAMEFQGTPITASFNVETKVTEVKPDGSVTEQSSEKDMVIKMNGTEQPAGDGSGQSTITRDARGVAQKIDISAGEDQGNKWRNERIVGLVYPEKAVSVGDKWTYEAKADKTKDIPAATYSYEVKGKDKYKGKDVLTIAFSFKETGADDAIASDGTMLVSVTSGEVLKADGKIKNFPIPQLGPTDVTWKQELAD